MKSVSVSVTEGESVTLRNDAEIQKDALMLWRFGDKGVLLAKIDIEANETSLHDTDERFRGRLQLDLQTGSLIITNTRTNDSGLYELQIRGIESSRRFLLSVNAVPEPQLSSGAKAGISFGFLVPVLLLVAAALAAFYYRHKIFKLKKKMDEEKKSVMEGDSLTLLTGLTNKQGIDTIEWCYENEDNRVAENNKGTIEKFTGADGRFRSKLRVDEETGALTISNIRTIHSGLYILKISSSSSRKSGCGTKSTTRTKRKRFIVTVSVRTLPVNAGDPVTLETKAELQSDDLMLWTFGPENRLVVKTDSGRTSISESFRDRLELDKKTGSLIIRNIGITDSGHFKLQIINSKQTTFRRFNVTLIGSTEEEVNEETQLIRGDVPDGVNEQQATSSV
ncbi:uncharacterized protein LOC125247202 [Megalobrama amblycephala]|nr:uncharacterized protein LOC125247202 [Megalobrama amblycephala]